MEKFGEGKCNPYSDGTRHVVGVGVAKSNGASYTLKRPQAPWGSVTYLCYGDNHECSATDEDSDLRSDHVNEWVDSVCDLDAL